jgi:hypothetical protein
MKGLWTYRDDSEREERMGAIEDENRRAPVSNKLKDRLE